MDDRTMIAAMAMQGLVARGTIDEPDAFAEVSISLADALLARLAKDAPLGGSAQARIDAAQASLADKDAEIAELRAERDELLRAKCGPVKPPPGDAPATTTTAERIILAPDQCPACGHGGLSLTVNGGACPLVPGKDGAGGCPDPLAWLRAQMAATAPLAVAMAPIASRDCGCSGDDCEPGRAIGNVCPRESGAPAPASTNVIGSGAAERATGSAAPRTLIWATAPGAVVEWHLWRSPDEAEAECGAMYDGAEPLVEKPQAPVDPAQECSECRAIQENADSWPDWVLIKWPTADARGAEAHLHEAVHLVNEQLEAVCEQELPSGLSKGIVQWFPKEPRGGLAEILCLDCIQEDFPRAVAWREHFEVNELGEVAQKAPPAPPESVPDGPQLCSNCKVKRTKRRMDGKPLCWGCEASMKSDPNSPRAPKCEGTNKAAGTPCGSDGIISRGERHFCGRHDPEKPPRARPAQQPLLPGSEPPHV